MTEYWVKDSGCDRWNKKIHLAAGTSGNLDCVSDCISEPQAGPAAAAAVNGARGGDRELGEGDGDGDGVDRRAAVSAVVDRQSGMRLMLRHLTSS